MLAEWKDTIDVFAPYRKGMWVKPYLALITGTHPKFKYAREFILADEIEHISTGRVFSYTLSHYGVYEQCVRSIDIATGLVLSRDREWFVFFDGEEFDIAFEEIPEALENLEWVKERFC